jgi:hypothetical protein
MVNAKTSWSATTRPDAHPDYMARAAIYLLSNYLAGSSLLNCSNSRSDPGGGARVITTMPEETGDGNCRYSALFGQRLTLDQVRIEEVAAAAVAASAPRASLPDHHRQDPVSLRQTPATLGVTPFPLSTRLDKRDERSNLKDWLRSQHHQLTEGNDGGHEPHQRSVARGRTPPRFDAGPWSRFLIANRVL